jgi:hypothetical protein
MKQYVMLGLGLSCHSPSLRPDSNIGTKNQPLAIIKYTPSRILSPLYSPSRSRAPDAACRVNHRRATM